MDATPCDNVERTAAAPPAGNSKAQEMDVDNSGCHGDSEETKQALSSSSTHDKEESTAQLAPNDNTCNLPDRDGPSVKKNRPTDFYSGTTKRQMEDGDKLTDQEFKGGGLQRVDNAKTDESGTTDEKSDQAHQSGSSKDGVIAASEAETHVRSACDSVENSHSDCSEMKTQVVSGDSNDPVEMSCDEDNSAPKSRQDDDLCRGGELSSDDSSKYLTASGEEGYSVERYKRHMPLVPGLCCCSSQEVVAEPEEIIKFGVSDGDKAKSSSKDSTRNINKDDDVVVLSDDDNDEELLGFHFNDAGVLVDKNNKQFVFQKYSSHSENQRRYEALGDKISDHIYGLLESRCKLKKIYIPLDAKKGEDQSFIFVSKGAFETEDKLIIFIHGSGVVRAGQWARSLIINHSLDHGTQIPFIEEALKSGYEVMVLNTNLNSFSRKKWPQEDECIRGSEDPERHAMYVWENLIMERVKAEHIAIVAHSYGGVVTKELLTEKLAQFTKRVFAIAFTDSVHSLSLAYDPPEVIKFFREHARNWVTSSLPLDKPIFSDSLHSSNDAPRFSAGHEKHEWTSWSSFKAVFKFLNAEYNKVAKESPTPSSNL